MGLSQLKLTAKGLVQSHLSVGPALVKILGGGTYETDVAARKPRAEYTRGLTIVGEAWDYMGNLTEVVYSMSFVD